MAEGPTKKELIAALKATGDGLVKQVAALDPDSLERGRYEGGWNAREILAHVASIEWTYKRLVESAHQPRATARPDREPQAPAPSGGNPIDDYNARQVARRAEKSVAELLLEFKENRAGTIAAVESCSEELLSQPTRSAGGAQGTLAQVLEFVAVRHVEQHTKDIVG
ncbi:MAG: DinB family protein [Chloroflexi bacterium]|nr:DinB family protein [Chloroflexota bacterium]